MRLTIDVTAEDIANGERENARSCPIALAVKRACPSAHEVEVDDRVTFDLDRSSYRAGIPEVVEGFIGRFDAGQNVEPLSFVLDFDEVDLSQ